MQTDSESGSRLEREQTFRPAWAEMFIYMAVMMVLFFAIVFISGLSTPQGASTSTAAVYTVLLFAIWLVALPAVQYVSIVRLSGGMKPHLRWSTTYPVVFGPWHAPGARFSRRAFAILCALPALCVMLLLYPLGVLAWRAGVEIVPEVMVVVASGLSLYFLRYTLWALSRPERIQVEVLEEHGLVRTVQ